MSTAYIGSKACFTPESHMVDSEKVKKVNKDVQRKKDRNSSLIESCTTDPQKLNKLKKLNDGAHAVEVLVGTKTPDGKSYNFRNLRQRDQPQLVKR